MSKGVCCLFAKYVQVGKCSSINNHVKITEVCPCMHIIHLYQDMNIVHLVYT